MSRKLLRRSLVSMITASVLTASAIPASANAPSLMGDQSVSDVTAATSAALGAADKDDATVDPFMTDGKQVSTDDGVSMSGDTLAYGGLSEMSLRLPIDTTEPGAATASGTLVYDSDKAGLHVEVQGIDGGGARVLFVADETYSTTPLHEYTQSVTVPDGAYLWQDGDGFVHVLQDRATPQDTVTAGNGSAVDADTLLTEVTEGDRALQADVVTATAAEQLLGNAPMVVETFQAPWAVDADGTQLPTRYEVRGDELIQVVDTTDATFPVVSDPIPLIAIRIVATRALAPTITRGILGGITRALGTQPQAFVAQTIKIGAKRTIDGGYKNIRAFKKAAGTKPDHEWHHIVEQKTMERRKWDDRSIHHPNNLIQLPTKIHRQCINREMGKKNVGQFGIPSRPKEVMRKTVGALPYTKQHIIGVELLRFCGVMV